MQNHATNHKLLLIALAGLIALTGCAGVSQEVTPTPVPEPDTPFTPVVSATGVLVPEQSVTLSMSRAGTLGELRVEEGSTVQAGEVLARLNAPEPLEQYQAARTAAELELVSARQAYDDLYENVSLAAAEAQKQLTEAQDALKDAQRKRTNLDYNRASQATIEAAEANYILAQNEVDRAQKQFNKVSGRKEDDPVRALALSNLSAAKQKRDAALRSLNWYKGNPSDLEISQADADLALAQARLDDAQRRLEILSKGPDPDQVALAEARIANAEAQLAAAQAAIDRLDTDLSLVAPFDGTVSELYVNRSEWVVPGQPILLLADLSQLRVETTDLNEIDVARLQVGDPVQVSFDALPDVVVQGTVTQIANKAGSGSGVNYKVEIELEEIPPALRWGMTAFVDIEIGN